MYAGRKRAWLLYLPVMVWLVSGCSLVNTGWLGPENDNELAADKTTLRFVYDGSDPSINTAYSDAIERFMAERPDIEIVQEPSGSGTYVDYLEIKDAIGEFPDMMEMRYTQWYANAGRIAVIPDELLQLVKNTAIVNGQVYAIPLIGPAPAAFLYNKEIFEHSGIDGVPRDWDEFLAACGQIRKLDIVPVGIGGRDSGAFGLLLNKFISDNVLAEQPNWSMLKTVKQVSFTDADFVQAMNDFRKLFEMGCVNADWQTALDDQTVSAFVARKAAMIYTPPYVIDAIAESDPYFKMGYFVPSDQKGRIVLDTMQGQKGLSIMSESAADPRKMEAFKAFVKFFFKPENYTRYLIAGMTPSTKEAVPYPMTDAMRDIESIMNASHGDMQVSSNMWGEHAVVPQFWEWFYEQTRIWISTDQLSLDMLLQQADKEWDRLTELKASSFKNR